MDISKIEIVDLVSLKDKDSAYIKPIRLHYKQNGKSLTWDCIKTHDSVSILIYNSTRNVLIFVRQFRPPVFLSILSSIEEISLENINKNFKRLNKNAGYTLELCAGIIDKKDLSTLEIAREEVIEETGYSPPAKSLQLITTFRTGVGSSGSLQYLYYCEVEDSMRVSSGGGVDNESIEVVELTLEQSKLQIYESDQETGMGRTPGLRFALSWFFYEKLPSMNSN